MNEVAQYFDGRADEWEKTFRTPSPVQETVALIGGVKAGSRVLDLGCGTGIMAPIYLKLCAEEVVALDIAPRMIEIAQEKYAQEPRVTFSCSDVLDFEDEEGFDTVVIYNAYPHFLDKEALVNQVKSLLKPQGRFVVAHSMGRGQMNKHHKNVPAAVSIPLTAAAEEGKVWAKHFALDSVVDAPYFYCFAGALR